MGFVFISSSLSYPVCLSHGCWVPCSYRHLKFPLTVYSNEIPLLSTCQMSTFHLFIYLLTYLKDFFYLFLGRKRGRETTMCGCLSSTPCGDLARNSGMCPDWESNWPPFDSWAGAQSTESCQPGLYVLFKSHFQDISSSMRFSQALNWS